MCPVWPHTISHLENKVGQALAFLLYKPRLKYKGFAENKGETQSLGLLTIILIFVYESTE